MSKYYWDKSGMERAFRDHDWQNIVFKEFESALTSKIRPFPCIFGVAGFQLDQLRYSFSDRMCALEVAPALKHFVTHSRSYGANTSLVVFSRPGPVYDIEYYRERFWSFLADLGKADTEPWPDKIPCVLDTPLWEFCFAGEPIFVVCNTPAHILRQSRRSSSFMITFQPRWVFETILGGEGSTVNATRKIRARLSTFDMIPPSPHLGLYGKQENREYKQYFLQEHNGEVDCPFHSLHNRNSLKEKYA